MEEKTFSGKAGMDGIDFRCLFLDPNSEEVFRAHKQQEIFVPELTSSILRARAIVGDNSELKKCFRCYSNRREEIILRFDNCILYTRPSFDASGAPQLLTNSGFEVFSTKTDKGKECIRKYEEIWSNAKQLF